MDGTLTEESVSRRWEGGGLHKQESERENDREHRLKPWRVEADWLQDGEEDDWTNDVFFSLWDIVCRILR